MITPAASISWETEALTVESWLTPVIFWLLPVIAPPNVKALMVKVPVELERVSVLRALDSKVCETEALPVIYVLRLVGLKLKSPFGEIVRLESPEIVVALNVGTSKLTEEEAPVVVMRKLSTPDVVKPS